MNWQTELQQLADGIKADKSITQPWKNYAVKHLSEAMALVKMGQTVAPASVGSQAVINSPNDPCICAPGIVRTTCPIHGK